MCLITIFEIPYYCTNVCCLIIRKWIFIPMTYDIYRHIYLLWLLNVLKKIIHFKHTYICNILWMNSFWYIPTFICKQIVGNGSLVLAKNKFPITKGFIGWRNYNKIIAVLHQKLSSIWGYLPFYFRNIHGIHEWSFNDTPTLQPHQKVVKLKCQLAF